MVNLRFIAKETLFSSDLKEQISLHLPGFNLLTESTDTSYDILIIDENKEKLKDFTDYKLPIFLLLSEADNSKKPGNCKVLLKPLSLRKLLDDLQSCINLYENTDEALFCFNKYELSPIKKEILNLRNKKTIKLTEKEVSILKYLYKLGDKVASKNDLLKEVWGYNPDITTHTIETHIYRLRQKVEQGAKDSQIIETIDNGYRLIR